MKKYHLLIAFFVIFTSAVMAQTQEPTGILVYFDDEFSLMVYDEFDTELYPEFGMEILPGYTIDTGESNVEIELDPNGSILKLTPGTLFEVEDFQGRNAAPANSFALLKGKLRAVAARAVGDETYSIRTPTAVAGVRGTDFGMEFIEGIKDTTFVQDGLVEMTNLATGEAVELGSGMSADTFAAVFEAVEMTQAQMLSLFSDLDFTELNPVNVPGHTVTTQATEEEPTEEPQEEETVEEEPVEEEVLQEKEAPEGGTEETVILEEPVPDSEEPSDIASGSAEGGLLDAFTDLLGLEIGSISIDNQTYSKAVMQPNIQFGKLKLGLYLPIVYSNDILDRNDWYKPSGNDEWSFGQDQDNDIDVYNDMFQDIALKIRYLEYGNPDFDSFYLKLGNLKTMTIGHGLLMYRYANDADFPAVRKVGINFGFLGKKGGIEGVVDDLGEADIRGIRLYGAPLWSGFKLGVSAIADYNPAETLFGQDYLGDPVNIQEAPDYIVEGADVYGEPIFIATGLDAELFSFSTALLSMKLYGDIGAMIPYFSQNVVNPYTGEILESGIVSEYVFRQGKPYNWGAVTGFLGNILSINYRLEYRYAQNLFSAPYFGASYDRTKGQNLSQVFTYLANPDASEFDVTTMGIYGNAGTNVFNLAYLEAGYFWPWEINEAGEIQGSDYDYFNLTLSVQEDVIPVIGIHGSLIYERRLFMPTLLSEGAGADLNLFDANTVVKGELIYPVTKGLDIAFVVGSSTLTDPDNPDKLLLDSNGNPKIVPTYNIETRVSF